MCSACQAYTRTHTCTRGTALDESRFSSPASSKPGHARIKHTNTQTRKHTNTQTHTHTHTHPRAHTHTPSCTHTHTHTHTLVHTHTHTPSCTHTYIYIYAQTLESQPRSTATVRGGSDQLPYGRAPPGGQASNEVAPRLNLKAAGQSRSDLKVSLAKWKPQSQGTGTLQ